MRGKRNKATNRFSYGSPTPSPATAPWAVTTLSKGATKHCSHQRQKDDAVSCCDATIELVGKTRPVAAPAGVKELNTDLWIRCANLCFDVRVHLFLNFVAANDQ